MDDSIYKVIEKLVNIPDDFRHTNKSVFTLLNESKYHQHYDRINADAIIVVLKKNPRLIDQWLQWSEDKRSFPTWYFTRGGDGKCFVGHSPAGREFDEINTSDEFKACATFIKLEAERIRILFNGEWD